MVLYSKRTSTAPFHCHSIPCTTSGEGCKANNMAHFLAAPLLGYIIKKLEQIGFLSLEILRVVSHACLIYLCIMAALLRLPSDLTPLSFLYIFYLARNADAFNLFIRRCDGRGSSFVAFRFVVQMCRMANG